MGLGAELARYLGDGQASPTTHLLSLSEEGNLPTWYSSSLLLGCSIVLGLIAADGGRFAGRWKLLAVVFVYMSIDEAIEIHEHLGRLMHLGGVLYFSWVVPASVVVLLLAAFFLPF